MTVGRSCFAARGIITSPNFIPTTRSVLPWRCRPSGSWMTRRKKPVRSPLPTRCISAPSAQLSCASTRVCGRLRSCFWPTRRRIWKRSSTARSKGCSARRSSLSHLCSKVSLHTCTLTGVVHFRLPAATAPPLAAIYNPRTRGEAVLTPFCSTHVFLGDTTMTRALKEKIMSYVRPEGLPDLETHAYLVLDGSSSMLEKELRTGGPKHKRVAWLVQETLNRLDDRHAP